jgi:uncharacterized protein (DUF1810 family)
MNKDDPHDLQRFVDAQTPVFEQACSELRSGRKQGHWMWFMFPQLKGLGHSAMAQKFGIASREEADAYLRHSIPGPRLRECSQLIRTSPYTACLIAVLSLNPLRIRALIRTLPKLAHSKSYSYNPLFRHVPFGS